MRVKVEEVIRDCDDLRRPPWRGDPNIWAGHCYVLAEVLYHMSGRDHKPQFIRHEGQPHWYLLSRDDSTIIDVTRSQFATPVPYHEGRGKGFLTREPSARAVEMMRRIREALT
jgi:hypothetical protein